MEVKGVVTVVSQKPVFVGKKSDLETILKTGGVGVCLAECSEEACNLMCQNAGVPITIPNVNCRHNGNNISTRSSAFNTVPLKAEQYAECSECGFACQ